MKHNPTQTVRFPPNSPAQTSPPPHPLSSPTPPNQLTSHTPILPQPDITPLISKSECYCLNECHDATHENLFIGDDRLALKSDADEQLLIHITFNETVKVSGLKFTAFNTANLDLQTSPKYIKVFVNRPSMGFSDAEDVEPTEEFELTEEEISNEKGIEKVRVGEGSR